MASRKCEGCGYSIHRPDGYLTKYKGKTWHVGCLEQHIISKRKTEELLERISQPLTIEKF